MPEDRPPNNEDLRGYLRLPRWYSRSVGFGVLLLVLYEIGYVGAVTPWLHVLTGILVALFAAEQLIGVIRNRGRRGYARLWALHIGIAAVTTTAMIALSSSDALRSGNQKLSIMIYGVVQGSILAALTLRALRHQAQITALNIRPGWLLMGSFGLLIAVGTLLLKLPRAVVAGADLSWLNALFTSTSAVCVTGLVVENTATFFAPTGQVIILCLMQLGGLGIMTLTFFLANMLLQGGSLHDRKLLGEMISEKHLAQVGRSVRFIIGFTFVTEAIGAVLLYHSLPEDRGIGERVFQAVFHAVSAFCNSGFSTLPDGMADRWVFGNSGVQWTLCALILVGGLGSMAVRDTVHWLGHHVARLRDRNLGQRRLRIHTRLVLMATLIVSVGGAVIVYASEFLLYSGAQNGGKALTALFHAIAARTAGFNTVDTGNIGPLTVHVIVLLMLIGGSPGGTAGGVRTTVFATAMLHLWNQLRVVPNLVLFRRRLPAGVGPRAVSILLMSLVWIFVNFAILRQLQPDVDDTRLVFELVSAFATTGLSMNLTASLTSAAKVLIIINMFVGRMALITVISTLIPASPRRQLQHPSEDIVLV